MESRRSYTFPFSRYPAVRIALLFIAGILFYEYYRPPMLICSAVSGLCGLAYLFVEWDRRQKISLLQSRSATLLFLLFIIFAGIMRSYLEEKGRDSILVEILQASPWSTVELSGHIENISYNSSGKPRWTLKVAVLQLDSLQVEAANPVRVRVLTDQDYDATIGDAVQFSGTVIPVSEKRNPADFDYKAYLNSQGIQAQVKLDQLIKRRENTGKLEWVWWREQALLLAEQNFNEKTIPIAKAILLGYKQDLDGEDKKAFARAGLSHIMAVSGLHVGFIIAPFWLVIPYFWTRRYGKQTGLVLLILLLLIYAGITGFSASVMRASVMAGFITYGKLFHKVNDSINLTAGAAIVLLLMDPFQVFQIGFQLSFSAVLIILLVLPVLQNRLPYWLRTHWSGKPLMVVIVSVVVQLGLYPLQVYYFGEVSLVSPLANALFVPLLGIIVPLSLVALFLSALVPVAGFILNYPSLLFLEAMAAFVREASNWSWAWFSAGLSGMLFFVFWFFVILFIAATRIPALRWKLLAAALGMLCLIRLINVADKFSPAKMEVVYFDVGQGDAALIRSPAGKHILVDAGVWSPGYNSGRTVILPHLKAFGVKKLDAIILSHPHSDHIGGILDIVEGIPVDTIYNSGFTYDSNLYKNYLSLATQRNIPVRSVEAGDRLNIDPSILLLILGPDGEVYNDDPNQHSVVFLLKYGETEFLFTGDAGEDQEERLTHIYGNFLDTDVLKAGHHGSRTSSGTRFLKGVTPDISVISLADRNRFGHPHPEAIHQLRASGTEILFTSLEGAIIYRTDGSRLQRVHWK